MCNKGLEVGRGCVTNLLCSPDGIMRPRRALKCIRRGLCGASATLQPTVNVVGRALVLGRGKDPRGVWTELRFILLGLPTCPPPPALSWFLTATGPEPCCSLFSSLVCSHNGDLGWDVSHGDSRGEGEAPSWGGDGGHLQVG